MNQPDQIEIIIFIGIGIGLLILFYEILKTIKLKFKNRRKNKQQFTINFRIKKTIFSFFGKTIKEVIIRSNISYIPVLFLDDYGNFILTKGEIYEKKKVVKFQIKNQDFEKPLTHSNLIHMKNEYSPKKKNLSESIVFFTDSFSSTNMKIIPSINTNAEHIAQEYFQKLIDIKDTFVTNNLLDFDGNQRKILLLMFMSGAGIISVIWVIIFLIFVLIF